MIYAVFLDYSENKGGNFETSTTNWQSTRSQIRGKFILYYIYLKVRNTKSEEVKYPMPISFRIWGMSVGDMRSNLTEI